MVTTGSLRKIKNPAPAAVPKTARRAVYLLFVLLAVFIVAGCSSAPVTAEKQVAQKPLLWPAPPEPARISYSQSISRPEDIGLKKGVFKRMLEFVLGPAMRDIIKPYGINTDTKGRLLVADTAFKRIHIYDIKERKYSFIDRVGKKPLVSPIGVATDGEDNIYVTDSVAAKVFVFNRKGKFLFDIDGGERPTGIAVNRELKLLYVVDTGANKVRVFDLKGNRKKTFGSLGANPGQFNYPVDIFIDRNGEVYVVDTMNYRVQIFNEQGYFISAFGSQGDGTGNFGRPKGVAVDSDGNIYVADAIFDTVQIFSRRGDFLLNFGQLGSKRGEFWMPGGLYIDNGDNVYVADTYNKRVQAFEYLGGGGQGF
ncbi:MAG: 6-bladed beta-propeller [Thermodesulfobacteriota bacterium]|nr:MAG: 6-bladed beta-propeller [Thermodesulfobacteriota bacterium]